MIRQLDYRRQFQDTFTKFYPELVTQAKTLGISNNLLTKTITFVVTEGCTLNCSYCYQVDKNQQAIMDKETARKAVDMILNDSMMVGYINSAETPGVIIDFIGGEPLLQVELMDFICDYFRFKTTEMNHPWAKYHMFNFTSNGTLYFDERVQKFIAKNAGRLSFTITIDGNKELHDACRIYPDGRGSYDNVYKAIKDAQARFNLDTSKITLAPENVMHTFAAIKNLSEMGIHELNANVVYEDVWVPERDAPILYQQMIKLADWIIENKMYEESFFSLFDPSIGVSMDDSDNQNWCGGNGQMLSIGTDGNLYPCIRFMKYSLNDKELPEFLIGNVDEGIESEEENIYLQQLADITRTSQSTDECINCSVGRGCAWCTGYNYDKFKTPNKRATFICWLHKARVLANYYYWNKLRLVEPQVEPFPLNLNEKEIEFITKGDTQWKNIKL